MCSIAMLTCSKFPDLYAKDQELLLALRDLGMDALPVVWDDEMIWPEAWDLFVFRNTWDYFEKKDLFFTFLAKLRKLDKPTLNPLSVVEKNIHKFYLKGLQADFEIIPTVFWNAGNPASLDEVIPHTWEQFVIKPAVSAGAFETRLFLRSEVDIAADYYDSLLKREDWLIQKYIPEIKEEGEISLLFIQKEFSHAVRKVPDSGDFRVQSIYGGKYEVYQPSNDLIKRAKALLQNIEEELLFARVDGVIHKDQFLLMEVELIEPDLYYEFSPGAVLQLAEAISQYGELICNKK